jgi:hypothetical protein
MSRRIINNNGTPRREIRKQLADVHVAAQALRSAMSKARPHGRDYQLNADPSDFDEDRKYWFHLEAQVSMIERYVLHDWARLNDDTFFNRLDKRGEKK